MKTKQDLLMDWSRWLARQRSYEDAPADTDGTRHQNLNAGNADVWFLAGTWGKNAPQPRMITVPRGTSLFIVVASAHATDTILQDPKRHPDAGPGPLPPSIPNPTTGQVLNRAQQIDSLFTDVHLAIDGKSYDAYVERITTPEFWVDVEGFSTYADYYLHPGLQKMISIGRVFLLESIASQHVINFNATGGLDPVTGEPVYPIDVTYGISVT